MTVPHRVLVWSLLLGGLLTLGLACDSGEPGSDPPEPGSLGAALADEEGLFEATDAVATSDHLFVALAQRINRREPGFLTYEDVWVLTLDRRAGTWSAVKVSRSPEAERHPTLALTPDGTLHALWAETFVSAIGSFDRALLHATRRSDGTWTAPQVAWQGPPEVGTTLAGADGASLAVDAAGRLHAVFSADYDDGGFPGPQVNVITYEGGAWSEPVLPATRADGQATVAAVPSGGLVVAYVDGDYGKVTGEGHTEAVMAIRSGDGGQTWSEPVVVAALGDEPGFSYFPRLAATPSGEVHLAWIRRMDGDPFPDEVWHAVSIDGGRGWGEPASVNPGNPGDHTSPPYLVAIPNGSIHLFVYNQPYFASEDGNELKHSIWMGADWSFRPTLTSHRIINGVLGGDADPSGCIHLMWNEAESLSSGEVSPTDLKHEQLGACPD